MSHDTPKLDQQQTLSFARDVLGNHLDLDIDGYQCTSEGLFDILLMMAAKQDTLESACAELDQVPGAEAYRRYLRQQLTLEALETLERQLNDALQAAIPQPIRQVLRDKGHDIACDLTDQPYYGKAPQEEALWVRAKAKAGTTRFYRIATAYVILQRRRFTLALHLVRPDESSLEVVQHLLETLARGSMAVGLLLLDKGFCSMTVMDYLSRAGYPALMACPIRGNNGGVRALCTGRRSYRTMHTFRHANKRYTAPVVLCRAYTTAQRTGRLQRRAVWLAYVAIHCELPAKKVMERYRRRFGIETSYRLSGQVRPWTTSPNPVYRFMLLALGFIVVNVWLHLRWMVAQVPRQGGRFLVASLLRLRRFGGFIIRAVEAKYGCPTVIQGWVAPIP